MAESICLDYLLGVSVFFREINGELVIGEVKEKEQAREAYEAAKKKGQSAGLVSEKLSTYRRK